MSGRIGAVAALMPSIESMFKNRRNWYLAAIMLALVLIGGIFSLRLSTVEPHSNPITQELTIQARERKAAESAVRQSGTNILPRLIRMAGSQDSFISDKLSKLSRGRISIGTASEDQDFAMFAFLALREKAQPAIPQLENLLTNSPAATSLNAALCLAAIGKPAVPIITREMTNANATVRAYATMAIGAVEPKSTESVQALMDRMQDESSTVRWMAIGSLGEIKAEPEVVLPALMALVQNPNGSLRHAAVRAIGNFGPEAKGAVGLLTPLLDDPDELMRFDAKQALRKINGRESP